MPGHWRITTRRSMRGAALVATMILVAACGEQMVLEPTPQVLLDEEIDPCSDDCGGDGGGGGSGGGYDVSYDYGTLEHTYRDVVLSISDPAVNTEQQEAFNYDSTAFLEAARNWDDPDDAMVVAWPAAAAAAVGVRGAVAAGRAIARTPRVRAAVTQGARWARDVTAGVAAALVAGTFPIGANEEINSIPVSDFDFIFDYSSQ